MPFWESVLSEEFELSEERATKIPNYQFNIEYAVLSSKDKTKKINLSKQAE